MLRAGHPLHGGSVSGHRTLDVYGAGGSRNCTPIRFGLAMDYKLNVMRKTEEEHHRRFDGHSFNGNFMGINEESIYTKKS